MHALKSLTAALLFTGLCLPAQGHSPVFTCFDNGNGTVTCEAGFTDGASAEGILVQVMDLQGKVLLQEAIGAENNVTFKQPDAAEYMVVFAAGEGHEIRIFSDEIE